jgi:hypothetical protein
MFLVHLTEIPLASIVSMAQLIPIMKGTPLSFGPKFIPYQYLPNKRPVCTPIHSEKKPRIKMTADPISKALFHRYALSKIKKEKNKLYPLSGKTKGLKAGTSMDMVPTA